jgi:hypothetical protein
MKQYASRTNRYEVCDRYKFVELLCSITAQMNVKTNQLVQISYTHAFFINF